MTSLYAARPFELLGSDVELSVSDLVMREFLDELFLACPSARGVGDPVCLSLERDDVSGWIVCRSGVRLTSATRSSLALDYLLWHLNQDLARRVEGSLLLHAAIASIDDHGIVLTGPSGAGKTTLVAHLVRLGLGYLSDEFAPLSFAEGTISPAPRPLKLEAGSWPSLGGKPPEGAGRFTEYQSGRWHVAPDRLRAGCVRREPVIPRLVVAPRFQAGAVLSCEPMSASETIVLLAEQAFNWRSAGLPGFRAVESLVRSSPRLRVVFGDAAEAARCIPSFLER